MLTTAAILADSVLLLASTTGLEVHLKAMNLAGLAVCGVIVLWSFLCWARLAGVAVQLRRCRKADEAFLKAHREASHSLEVFQDGLVFEGSPKHAVYLSGSRELVFHLMGADSVDKNFSVRLRAAGRISPSQMDSVRRMQERTTTFAAREMTSGLGAGAVAVIPYLGVLGALLSVMVDAGGGESGAQLVISALAPMALAVVCFIPLMLWHNGLVQRSVELAGRLGDFGVELATQFDRAFVDHRKPLDSLPSLGSMVPSDGPDFTLPPSDTARSMSVIVSN